MSAALALPHVTDGATTRSRKLASGVSALSGALASALLDAQPANDTGEIDVCACDFTTESLIWTSKDRSRFRGGLNFYEYSADDPVNHIDPSGHIWRQVERALGGGLHYLRELTRGEAIRAVERGADVATDRSKAARRLAKDISPVSKASDLECHANRQTGEEMMSHYHALDEDGDHLDDAGHVFVDPELKSALPWYIPFLDANDNNEFDSQDFLDLLSPVPIFYDWIAYDPYPA